MSSKKSVSVIEHSKKSLGAKKYNEIQGIRFLVRVVGGLIGLIFLGFIINILFVGSFEETGSIQRLRALFLFGMTIFLFYFWMDTSYNKNIKFKNIGNIVGKKQIFIVGIVGLLIIGLLNLWNHNYNECIYNNKIKFNNNMIKYENCLEDRRNGKTDGLNRSCEIRRYGGIDVCIKDPFSK